MSGEGDPLSSEGDPLASEGDPLSSEGSVLEAEWVQPFREDPEWLFLILKQYRRGEYPCFVP